LHVAFSGQATSTAIEGSHHRMHAVQVRNSITRAWLRSKQSHTLSEVPQSPKDAQSYSSVRLSPPPISDDFSCMDLGDKMYTIVLPAASIEGFPMAIDEKVLLELCDRAAKEQDSKKLFELTQQIDRLLAEVCGMTGHRNDDRPPSRPN